MKWQNYDPTWLVELAKEQATDEPWLPQALARCTSALQQSRAYIYFVEPDTPNEPGSCWQFERSLVLEDERCGELVLDILQDNRVGGIEFLKYL